MSSPVTNQETQAQGSYISLAASITAKFKCCISSDTHETNQHNHAHNTGTQPLEPITEQDVEISVGEDDAPPLKNAKEPGL